MVEVLTQRRSRRVLLVVLIMLFPIFHLWAQTDPGPRPGPAGAGEPIAGLTQFENSFFLSSKETFEEVDSVSGTEPGAPAAGLGPRFNMNQCAGCHIQPAVGGTSPSPTSRQNPRDNPQVAVATRFGTRNTVPFFIRKDGPVREARFKRTATGKRDGGVHDLFVISGRTDAPGCNIVQPDFATAAAQNNLIFRIPTPLFGSGLIQEIADSTILANKNANSAAKQALGIEGRDNTNGNDGTITRFGWKAQNKSLELFAGEAYNVEQGVSNEIFQNERDETPSCIFNSIPEDHTNFAAATPTDVPSDAVKFAIFMRFLAPPTPACGPAPLPACSSSVNRGQTLFSSIGCALCHTPSLTTALSSSAALSNQTANLFSDLLLHHMGPRLADGIAQGNAGGDDFRTAPLWGVGQRLFFLHDGRTSDLLTAIQAHASSCPDDDPSERTTCDFEDSEANAVITRFNQLSVSEKQDILNFLRSL